MNIPRRTFLHLTAGAALMPTVLRSAMAQLDERSRRIIEARWLRDDDDTSTLQQLADEYGVSAERIRQIESKALKMMRSQMATLQ